MRTVPTDRPTVSCEHGRRAAAPYRLRKRTPGRHAARAHVSPDDGGDGDARVLRHCLLPAESARVTNDDDGPVAATLRRRCVVEKGRGDGKNVAGARRIFPISARRVVLLIIIPANNEIREKGLGRVFSLYVGLSSSSSTISPHHGTPREKSSRLSYHGISRF